LVTRVVQHQPVSAPELADAARAVQVHAHELNAPVRVPDRREDVEPLSADLRRLHVTVTARLLKKLGATGVRRALRGPVRLRSIRAR
jgi:hypothetical protein